MAELVGYSDHFKMGGDDIIRDVAEDVLYEDLDWSPITTFLSQINGNDTCHNIKFEWQESVADKPYVTCTTAIVVATAGTGQSATLNSNEVTVGNRYYQSTSRQTFQVTAVSGHPSTTTTCTIVRVPLTAATTAVSAGALMVSLGNYIVTGGYYPIPFGQTPTFLYNYTQLCTRTVGITKTMKQVSTYHGSQFESDKIEKLQRFRCDQDRVILFGEGFNEQMTQTNENGQSAPGSNMGSKGIEKTITTHVQTGTTITEANLDAFARNHIWGSRNSGSKAKLMLAGPGVIQAINGFAKNRLQLMEGAQDYGLDIYTYISWAGRRLHIMEEREFTDNPDYNNTMFVLDVDDRVMRLVQLGDYFMQVFPIDPPDRDVEAICFRSEFGLRMKAESKHAIWYGA